MKEVLTKAFLFVLIMTIICGVAYTGLVTIVAQIFFRDKANGSIIEVNGIKYGSSLIGQSFTGSGYMWGRAIDQNKITAELIDSNGKNSLYPKPSNISPVSNEYAKAIRQRVRSMRLAHLGNKDIPVPVELVTGSGSGLDPHISVKAAMYQVYRIAEAREINPDEVIEIIDKCTEEKFLNIFGERTVNVLKVNLCLDGILK